MADLLDRLAESFDIAPSGCWEWNGSNRRGYGVIQGEPATRVVWKTVVGPVPKGYEMDHLCRNPPCVNPDHLEPVTPRVNKQRANGWAGVNHRKTACVHGHEYTPENTRMRADGRRRCRECDRAMQRTRDLAAKGRSMTDQDWALTSEQRPPEGATIEVVTPGGDKRTLVYAGNLWWLPDRSMYVYFTPTLWRATDRAVSERERDGS